MTFGDELLLYVQVGNVSVLLRAPKEFPVPNPERVVPPLGKAGPPGWEGASPLLQGLNAIDAQRYGPTWLIGVQETHVETSFGPVRVVWPAGIPEPPREWVQATVSAFVGNAGAGSVKQ